MTGNTNDLLRDFIGEQLAYHATHIACARMFVDIGDDAGLGYCLDAGKAHFVAARDAMRDLRRQNGVRFQEGKPR